METVGNGNGTERQWNGTARERNGTGNGSGTKEFSFLYERNLVFFLLIELKNLQNAFFSILIVSGTFLKIFCCSLIIF